LGAAEHGRLSLEQERFEQSKVLLGGVQGAPELNSGGARHQARALRLDQFHHPEQNKEARQIRVFPQRDPFEAELDGMADLGVQLRWVLAVELIATQRRRAFWKVTEKV